VYIVNDSDGTEKQICALFGRITVETAVDPYLHLIQSKKRPNRFRKNITQLSPNIFFEYTFSFQFYTDMYFIIIIIVK